MHPQQNAPVPLRVSVSHAVPVVGPLLRVLLILSTLQKTEEMRYMQPLVLVNPAATAHLVRTQTYASCSNWRLTRHKSRQWRRLFTITMAQAPLETEVAVLEMTGLN